MWCSFFPFHKMQYVTFKFCRNNIWSFIINVCPPLYCGSIKKFSLGYIIIMQYVRLTRETSKLQNMSRHVGACPFQVFESRSTQIFVSRRQVLSASFFFTFLNSFFFIFISFTPFFTLLLHFFLFLFYSSFMFFFILFYLFFILCSFINSSRCTIPIYNN